MKLSGKALAIILLIASIVFLSFAFMGHEAAWSSAAACSCGAAIICNVLMNKKNRRD